VAVIAVITTAGLPVAVAGSAHAGSPPPTPVSVAATPDDSSSTTISWVDPSGGVPDGGGQTQFTVSNGAEQRAVPAGYDSFVWTGEQAGQYMCFQVQAFALFGSSAWSAYACATTPDPAQPPPVPPNVRASAPDPTHIVLAWDSSALGADYEISNGSQSEWPLDNLSWNWGIVNPGTYMCFRLRAYFDISRPATYSAWSPYTCVTTPSGTPPPPSPAPPPAPAGVTAVATGPNSIHVSWADHSGGTAQSVVSDGSVSSAALAPGVTGYDWTGLAPGTYICLAVRAQNAAGSSAWSPYSCATTTASNPPPANPPPAPTGVTAVATGTGTIRVSWADHSGGTAQYVVDNGNTAAPLQPAGTTGYDWTGLAPGTYMCLTVAAKNGAGQSAWSPYACATTFPSPPPVPTGVTATVTSPTTIHVSWTDHSGGTAQYVVDNGNTAAPLQPAGTTGYDWTGLAPGTYMCLTVAAVSSGGQSPWSPYACTTIPDMPPVPGAVTATATSPSTIHVTWIDNSQGTAQYVVDNGNIAAPLQPAGTSSYDWTGLTPGTYMCFTIAAKNSSGQSAWSRYSCATTPLDPYAILGDSYSSGEGTGNYDPGTDTATDTCHRSPQSYGRVYATGPPVAYVPAQVQHLACSGATIANLTTSGQNGEPAQIGAIDPTASLVTVTIGGNDAGFAGVLTRCATPSATPCEDYYTQNDANNLDARIEALKPSLVAVYQAIRTRAPNARIMAVTYPSIFAGGTEGQTQKTCLNIGAIYQSDVEWLIRETFHLDDVIDDAAQQTGIQLLDERYAFTGHELCTATPWVNGLLTPPIADVSKAFHPTAAGYAKVAADLAAALATPTGIASLSGRGEAWPGWRNSELKDRMPSTVEALAMLSGLFATNPSNTSYDESTFGDWTTALPSVAPCDRRVYVLERDADAAPPTQHAATPPCAISWGQWQSPYDNPAGARGTVSGDPRTVPGVNQSPVDVDHVVSKKDAWVSGADLWVGNGLDPNEPRKDFANDATNLELLTVSYSTNRSKSNRTPDDWTPDTSGNPAFTCDFMKMYVATKKQYDLTISDAEYWALRTRLSTCTGAPVPTGTPAPLTLYQTLANDTLVPTARQADNSPLTTPTAVSTTIGSATGWVELLAQGGTGSTAATEPAASGHGYLWDVTTLEGQQIPAGAWNLSQELKTTTGSVTADVHLRVFKLAANGTYTLIAESTQPGMTITQTNITATLPATNGPPTECFLTGDKLYYDVVLDITANTMGSTGGVRLNEGGSKSAVITPGYLPGCS
jgi:lysophospholipase L1-like esterase